MVGGTSTTPHDSSTNTKSEGQFSRVNRSVSPSAMVVPPPNRHHLELWTRRAPAQQLSVLEPGRFSLVVLVPTFERLIDLLFPSSAVPAMHQAVLDPIPGPISSRHHPLMLSCQDAPKKPQAGSL